MVKCLNIGKTMYQLISTYDFRDAEWIPESSHDNEFTMQMSYKMCGLMDWWINKNSCQITTWSSVGDLKWKKHCYIKILFVFAFFSLSERRCHVLHTQVCLLAPLIVFNIACGLTIWEQTLRASLTLRERFINLLSSFYLRKPLSNTLKRKALHYYLSSVIWQLRRFKCVLLPSSVHYYPSK